MPPSRQRGPLIDAGWRLAERYEALRPILVKWFQARRAPDPEELADRTFERCLKAEARGQALCFTYVYRAAKTVLIDELRTLPRRPESLELAAFNEGGERVTFTRQLIARGPTPEEAAIGAHETERILGLLTEKQAQVVRLFAAGYSHEDIADELDTTIDGTKKLLYRARHAAARERAREDTE